MYVLEIRTAVVNIREIFAAFVNDFGYECTNNKEVYKCYADFSHSLLSKTDRVTYLSINLKDLLASLSKAVFGDIVVVGLAVYESVFISDLSFYYSCSIPDHDYLLAKLKNSSLYLWFDKNSRVIMKT